jgi:hypothetical protein
MTTPETNEYASYFGKYVSLVNSDDIVATLEKQNQQTIEFLTGLGEGKGEYRYAPEKWTVKEVVGHITDTERIFAYRALRIGRGDKTPLPGFDQDVFAANVDYSAISLSDLSAEFSAVRRANLLLFRGFNQDAWLRRGVASDNELSARAAAYIIAGHELYHLDILKTRYL